MKKLYHILFILINFSVFGQKTDCWTPPPSSYNNDILLDLKNLKKSMIVSSINFVSLKLHIGSTQSIENLLPNINKTIAQLNNYYFGAGVQFFIESNIESLNFSEINITNANTTVFIDPYFNNTTIPDALLPLVNSNGFSQEAINLYIFDKLDQNGSINGIAMFPNISSASNIVLVKTDKLFPSASLYHELGHYFNLYHTHHNNIGWENEGGKTIGELCASGDYISDTPFDPYGYTFSHIGNDPNPYYIENAFVVSNCIYTGSNNVDICGNNFNTMTPPWNNIMSYGHNFECERNHFTNNQYTALSIGVNIRRTYNTYNINGNPNNTNPPSELSVKGLVSSKLITWSDNSTTETGYLIERSTNTNDDFVCIGGVAPNITTFTDNTILPNTNYYYRIRASNATIYNCNTSPVTPYLSGERTVITSNWYAQDVQKATRLGLMDKNNWTNDVVSDNSNITVGEVARSLVITANLLNITGFNAVNPICWDNNPNNAYVAHLKNNNFLPSSVQSNDLITKGLLCDLIKNIIFESNTTYPYQVTRPDMSSIIASTAPYKSSIEYLYQRIGFVKSSNGKKLGDYFFNGKYISTLNNRKIVGTENVTRAIFAKFIATAYEFKYYQLNQKVVPNARIAQTNSVFDDIIIIGSKAEFDNDITGIPPTVTVDGTTEFLRSGQSKNFSFSTDQLSDGTKVFFYWNIDGGSQGLQLVPMPQYSTNFQGVILTVPIVTSPQVFQFYIHISTIDGRTAEMFKDIMVVPNDPNNNTNLTTGEYFVDNDLGIGQATVLPITLNNYGVDATIPIPTNNLTQGIHTVGIRVKDSNNKWSITHTKTFLVLGIGTGSGSRITQIGYFFDSQNAENIANVSVDANNQIALPITVNLTQGIHTVSFRVKDSQNKWSLYHTRTFLVLGQGSGGSNAITQVEYFFDADPLEANRIRQNLTLDANNQVIIPLNISLPQGIHTVSFRVKDGQDKWSIFHTRTFLVIGSGSGNATISTIEYFMDSDPGFGNGTQVAYATTNNQAVLLNVNVGSLTHGVHVLFVRVKNSLNQWSLTHAKAFVVMPNLGSSSSISRVEYFIDDANPSLGNGISANFIPNPTSSDVLATFDLNISQLSLGIHRINVRTKDNNNQWSSLVTANFEIIQIPCPQNKTITETESSGQLIHQASSTVNLQNTTYNGTVKGEIKAGGSITIGPNTTFDAGTVIKIYVGGCANN